MSFKWPFKKGSEGEAGGDSAEKEVVEMPVEEAPAENAEQPAEETPVEEAPAETVEAPAEEAPAETAEAPAENAEQPQEEAPAENAEQPQEEAPAESAEQPQAEVPAEPAKEAPAEDRSLRPSQGKLRAWLLKMDSRENEEEPQKVEEAPQPVKEEHPEPVEEEPQPVKERPQSVKERPRRVKERPEPEEHRGQSLKSELAAVFVEFVRLAPWLVVSVGGFLLVVILLLSLNSKLKTGIDMLQQLQQPAAPVAGEVVQQQDSAPQAQNQVSTPAQPVMAPLAQQDILVELGIENTENGPAVRTCVDMGGFYDVAVAHVGYDKDTGSFSGARIDLREAQSCITLEADTALRNYSHCEGVIQVDIAVDEAVLGAMGEEEKPQYEWFYRTDPEDEWQALDQKLFMISDDAAKVTYLAEDLAKKLDSDEVAQFRLVYRRYNVKGGSLTVVVTGMSVADATLEEALSEEEA